MDTHFVIVTHDTILFSTHIIYIILKKTAKLIAHQNLMCIKYIVTVPGLAINSSSANNFSDSSTVS